MSSAPEPVMRGPCIVARDLAFLHHVAMLIGRIGPQLGRQRGAARILDVRDQHPGALGHEQLCGRQSDAGAAPR